MVKPAPHKIYWDSCAFLAWFQNEPEHVDACRDALERAQNGLFIILTSALTLAETLWLQGAPKLSEDKADQLNRFFRRKFIRVVNVDRAIAESARPLVWRTNIKPKDAIHVATALRYKCAFLETFDQALIRKSGRANGLQIREPLPHEQASLGFPMS